MELYIVAVLVLFAIAIMDLMVGVSNDAVNFLNSSVGSRVAPRHVIMIVASLGILAGVTFSSGMMEVARKGIFHPRLFLMPELITIFLAVMLTDVVLLDLFNTFGFPTSTTVSIVFELLGAAIAVSLFKIFASGQNLLDLAQYINTGKALAIISGILLSVGVAFVCGAAAQYLTRLLFTFNYEKRLKRYGGLWGGLALSMIVYFILIKGSKGASFMGAETVAWIKTHTLTILGTSFLGFAALFQTLAMATRVNILKPIVLVGTFALAMAFAANDLVNFIGVPLAGFHAMMLAKASASPLTASMDALQKAVQTPTIFLLVAGGIMVGTLWVSRKARTVTKTEVSLGRQDEGLERFDSSQMSRVVVRMFSRISEIGRQVAPAAFTRWIDRRFDTEDYEPAAGYDGTIPDFDLLRASVNLMVASALVSWATSMKLPLSTTYVTFMVAMGTSLADRAWGLESAVYRVTGVLMVIGGWFFTALMAFSVSLTFAFVIKYFRGAGVFLLLMVAGYVIMRNFKIHGRREKAAKELELLDLKRVSDADFAVRTCFEHSGRFLEVVNRNLSDCFDGILTENRKPLKRLRRETSKVQAWSNIIAANIFKTMRLLQHEEVKAADKYGHVISALQEISESLRDLILRCHVHTSNQHAGLLPTQKKELQQVRKRMETLLAETARILLNREPFNYGEVAAPYVKLKDMLEDFDQAQIERIRSGVSKTRLSILYYGLTNACLKISEQTLHLVTLFDETLPRELRDKNAIVQDKN
ncbi:MAG: inorganic phosphate transporter [Desulfobacterales bacterium]|nr:inorganic phosphate transporter [Desulfobacterales bacterium]MDJ0855516.1 inorganic phosphate transporter [Desulfobacterales bacterium]